MAEHYDLSWMISVDDHVLEPGDVWQTRVPEKFRAKAPRLVQDSDGEYWVYEDKKLLTLGLAATVGKSKEMFSPEPITYSEMRPGCYNSVERAKDMDEAGVLASISFPSLPRFCGQLFYEGQDKELGEACLDAWNDWMFDEWCGSVPGRYIPMMLIPLWDPQLAARKIDEGAQRGARAIAFSENPVPLGLPSIHDVGRYWDPVFAAVQANDMVICMHQGSSSTRPRSAPDTPELAVMAWAIGALQSATLLDWVFSDVFERFPTLRISLAEGGIGWMPYVLERAEQVLDKQRHWASTKNIKIENSGLVGTREKTGADPMTLNVREVFRDHVFGCFIEDESGLAAIDKIGVDNVMVETDYPHSDTTWPNSLDVALKQLDGMSDGDKYKILRGNAERVFRFTPTVPQR